MCGSDLGGPEALTTCPKRSWWKIHTQSPSVPFSHTKSTRGLGVRIWATWPQRFFCGNSPNLVKTTLVYPHFAEEKNQSHCGYSTKTRQKSQWNCDDFSTSTTTASPHCSLYELWGLWISPRMWAFSTLDCPPSWSWMCPAGRSPALWFLHWPHQGVQQHPSATHLWVGCTPWGLLTCFGALECFFDYLHQILWTPGCPGWKYLPHVAFRKGMHLVFTPWCNSTWHGIATCKHLPHRCDPLALLTILRSLPLSLTCWRQALLSNRHFDSRRHVSRAPSYIHIHIHKHIHIQIHIHIHFTYTYIYIYIYTYIYTYI